MISEPHGQFLQPDYSKGDESTVGGYAAVHARPPALQGPDGMAYSIEILSDSTGEKTAGREFGAYFLFLQWRRIGEQGVAGHLESSFLAFERTAARARRSLGETPLADAQRLLDAMVVARDAAAPPRQWRDVVRGDGDVQS